MDTDSDSGGSYISATPSSDPEPIRRPAALQLPSLNIKLKARVSSNSRLNPKSTVKRRKPVPKAEICSTSVDVGAEVGSCRIRVSANTRPILNPKGCLRRKEKLEQKVEEELEKNVVDFSTFNVGNLPFQIRQCVDVNGVGCGGVENLPAGFFSKNASFSKMGRSSLDLESADLDLAKTVKGEEVVARGLGSALKKCLNLVGGSIFDVPPKKKAKVSNEGNFVRLTINGYGHKRKFMNKGSRRSQFSSSGKRYFKNLS